MPMVAELITNTHSKSIFQIQFQHKRNYSGIESFKIF